MIHVRDEWLRAGLSAQPADRPAAEAGIRKAYAAAGLPPSPTILWFDGPVEACALASLLMADRLRPQSASTIGLPVWEHLLVAVRDLARAEASRRIAEMGGPGHDSEIGSAIGDDKRELEAAGIWQSIRSQVWTLIANSDMLPKAEPSAIRIGDPAWAAVREEVWEPVHREVWDDFWGAIWPTLPFPISGWLRSSEQHLWSRVWWDVWKPFEQEARKRIPIRLSDSIWAGAWRQVGSQLLSAIGTTCFGQHDAASLCFYDALSRMGEEIPTPFEGLQQATRSAGWWWPFSDLVLCTERPTRLERDGRGRLHSTSGMALQYPDGWGVWSIHGVHVDERIVMRPDSFSPQEILEERNAERRRIILEQYGYEPFIRNLGARPLDNDEHGTLYRIQLSNDEPLVMVHVVNSTPEPDGSFREFFIRVPPTIRRARHAVAWTFGLDPEDYHPVVES